ncbi:MAG: carboxypeptidase-like regulatory domain-containing protein [Candidatus Kapabacteria bacterium]|nr:carboxypeptidase-like regulatory domain-containing protein [Candidatus Kapabacteria bacterium]
MKFKVVLVLLFSFLFLYENSLALEAPKPPLKFTGYVQDNNQNNANSVYFKWMKNPEGTQPNLFILYIATENTQDLSKFKRFDYIKAGNQLDYSFVLGGLKAGQYSFYLTSGAIDGNYIIESSNSDIVFIEIKNNEKPFIRIISQPPTYAAIGKEYIYNVKAITNLPDNCPLVYSLAQSPKGMKIDETTGIIRWVPEENGVFKVSIMVGTTCKINVEPAFQDFAITVGQNNQGYVKITSQPPHTAFVGEPLIYQIIAQSNIRCPILFDLTNDVPNEVGFDRQSGLLKWIPTKPGTYKFIVKAYLECDDKISDSQTFVIEVKEGHNDDFCALITGFVEFDNENVPVKEGRVNAWRIDKRTNANLTYSAPIAQGNFTLKVPAGIYFLNFDGPEFLNEWYKDAISIDKAQKLELKCDDQIKLNITVERKKLPKTFTVSGNVSNESGDKPLLASIQFIPIDLDKNYRDPNQPVPNTFTTRTDEKGNYSIKLPDNFIYRAYAIPVDNNYYPQYYDKVDSPFEADLIELTGDISGIDFRLKERQQFKNSFTGKVVSDNDGSPLHSLVFAYLVNQNNNSNQRFSRMAETDRSGYFRFENLIPGQYVLLSIPYDRAYTPGYYKMGEVATLKWREATRINVGENMIDIIFEIRHKNRAGLKGIIQIDGVVIDNSGVIKKSDSPSTLNTLAGAFVYVIDEFGELSDYTFTDINGRFYLSEVSDGENTLVVDYVGFKTFEQKLITDYSENIRNSGLLVALDNDEPLSNDDLFDNNNIEIAIYPNPVNSNMTLKFSGKAGIANIYIYDNLGNLVHSAILQTTEGINITKLDLRNLNQGIYFLRIDRNNKQQTTKFTIIR